MLDTANRHLNEAFTHHTNLVEEFPQVAQERMLQGYHHT